MLERHVTKYLNEAIRAVPVVVLEGGRAVGKSTLCEALAIQHGWAKPTDLSDPAVLETVALDPDRWLAQQPTPCVIDEAQLLPDLPLAVKRVVDSRRSPGQFLLTGSARLGRSQLGGSDPLAGRCIRVRMWSLTEYELAERQPPDIAAWFDPDWAPTEPTSSLASRTAERRWPPLGGLAGLTGVLDPQPDDTQVALWDREIDAYVEAVLPLGVAGSRADLGLLKRLFRYLAANSGQHLNAARAASELGISVETVRAGMQRLDSCFLIHEVLAHRPSEHKTLTQHPKVFAADTGLATWAARAWSQPTTAALTGSLNETRVAHGLCAGADASVERVEVRHWRDKRNQKEIDFLLINPAGKLVAIEVKSASSIGPSATKGLLDFADRHQTTFARGIVFYDGDTPVDLSPSGQRNTFVGLPISAIA